MRVAFRADASISLGAGHVMRCLTLADEWKGRGAETLFVSRNTPGHLGDVVRARGHAVSLLPDSADRQADAAATQAALAAGVDWLVVDHYALDARWERAQRPLARHILALDDMADRPHDCDLLLDQNLPAPGRYDGLLPAGCGILAGPRYALLRPAFHALRQRRGQGGGEVKNLLVFFGGGDASNETGKVLEALAAMDAPGLTADVVTGGGNPLKEAIRVRCEALPGCRFHCQVEDMAGLMSRADLALGATGVSTWERACLGLPTLAVSVAENQHAIARAAAEAGLLTWLGAADRVDASGWRRAVAHALASPRELAAQSRAGMALVDGLGTRRVADRMRI